MPQEVKCGECGSPMVLRQTKDSFTDEGTRRLFYSCSRFPACRGTCGAYSDGSPAGIPADAATKAERHTTYLALEDFRLKRKWNKRGLYSWLAVRLKIDRSKCHITYFDIPTCKNVLAVLERANTRQSAKGAAK